MLWVMAREGGMGNGGRPGESKGWHFMKVRV